MISKMASQHKNAIKKLPQGILTKRYQLRRKGSLLPSLLAFTEAGLKITQNSIQQQLWSNPKYPSAGDLPLLCFSVQESTRFIQSRSSFSLVRQTAQICQRRELWCRFSMMAPLRTQLSDVHLTVVLVH